MFAVFGALEGSLSWQDARLGAGGPEEAHLIKAPS